MYASRFHDDEPVHFSKPEQPCHQSSTSAVTIDVIILITLGVVLSLSKGLCQLPFVETFTILCTESRAISWCITDGSQVSKNELISCRGSGNLLRGEARSAVIYPP